MTIIEIRQLIESKKQEHRKITVQIQNDLDILKKKLIEMKENNAERDAMFMQVQKIAILKDKSMFHHACALQLEELLEEIK